jgi:hypothetical protein
MGERLTTWQLGGDRVQRIDSGYNVMYGYSFVFCAVTDLFGIHCNLKFLQMECVQYWRR